MSTPVLDTTTSIGIEIRRPSLPALQPACPPAPAVPPCCQGGSRAECLYTMNAVILVQQFLIFISKYQGIQSSVKEGFKAGSKERLNPRLPGNQGYASGPSTVSACINCADSNACINNCKSDNAQEGLDVMPVTDTGSTRTTALTKPVAH